MPDAVQSSEHHQDDEFLPKSPLLEARTAKAPQSTTPPRPANFDRTPSKRRTSISQPNPLAFDTQVPAETYRPSSSRKRAPPLLSFPKNFNQEYAIRPSLSRRPSSSGQENPFAASSIKSPSVISPDPWDLLTFEDPWDLRTVESASGNMIHEKNYRVAQRRPSARRRLSSTMTPAQLADQQRLIEFEKAMMRSERQAAEARERDEQLAAPFKNQHEKPRYWDPRGGTRRLSSSMTPTQLADQQRLMELEKAQRRSERQETIKMLQFPVDYSPQKAAEENDRRVRFELDRADSRAMERAEEVMAEEEKARSVAREESRHPEAENQRLLDTTAEPKALPSSRDPFHEQIHKAAEITPINPPVLTGSGASLVQTRRPSRSSSRPSTRDGQRPEIIIEYGSKKDKTKTKKYPSISVSSKPFDRSSLDSRGSHEAAIESDSKDSEASNTLRTGFPEVPMSTLASSSRKSKEADIKLIDPFDSDNHDPIHQGHHRTYGTSLEIPSQRNQANQSRSLGFDIAHLTNEVEAGIENSSGRTSKKEAGSEQPVAQNAETAMRIPRARSEIPPPLPPPRHIDTSGRDPGWQWGNTNSPRDTGFGGNRLATVRPGWQWNGGATGSYPREPSVEIFSPARLPSVMEDTQTAAEEVHNEPPGRHVAPIKGILRKATEKFPEDPALVREGVAPYKDALKDKYIPIGARWTRIDRRLVNPEALEEAKERFEERVDCVMVPRVLTREEIQKLANRTKAIRERREATDEAREPESIAMNADDNDELGADKTYTAPRSAIEPFSIDPSFGDSHHSYGDFHGLPEVPDELLQDSDLPQINHACDKLHEEGVNSTHAEGNASTPYTQEAGVQELLVGGAVIFGGGEKKELSREKRDREKGEKERSAKEAAEQAERERPKRTEEEGRLEQERIQREEEESIAAEGAERAAKEPEAARTAAEEEEAEASSGWGSLGSGFYRRKKGKNWIKTKTPKREAEEKKEHEEKEQLEGEAREAAKAAESAEAQDLNQIFKQTVGMILEDQNFMRIMKAPLDPEDFTPGDDLPWDPEDTTTTFNEMRSEISGEDETSDHEVGGIRDEGATRNVLKEFEQARPLPTHPVESWLKTTLVNESTFENFEWDYNDSASGPSSYAASVASIFSVASLASSASVISKGSGYSKVQIATATKVLLSIFYEDEALLSLYKRAIEAQNIGPERLERNLRRLFRAYAGLLEGEATERLEHLASRLVRAKSASLAKSVIEKLQIVHASTELSPSERNNESSDEEEDGADSHPVNEDAFEDLVTFRQFLVESEAFKTFHNQLQAFVIPNLAPADRTETVTKEALGCDDEGIVKHDVLRSPAQSKTMSTWHEWFKDVSQALSMSYSEVFALFLIATGFHLDLGTLLFTIDHLLVNMGLLEPALDQNKTRLRWRCKCGDSIYSDIMELREGGIAELIVRMQRSPGVRVHAAPYSHKSSNQQYIVPRPDRWLRNAITKLGKVSGGSSKSPPSCLPQHNSPYATTSCSTSTNPSTTKKILHLSMCMHRTRRRKIVKQDRVDEITTDRTLLRFLQRQYATHRGRFLNIARLKTVQRIVFVKFRLPMGGSVDVQHHLYCIADPANWKYCECTPPPNKVGVEYEYSPSPPKTHPPIPPEYLASLFTCATDVHEEDDWILNQLPKRTCGVLQGQKGQPAEGWGIYFLEGWDREIISLLILFIFFLASLLFGVLWWNFQFDLQGGFGVSAYMMAVCTIVVSVVVTRLENKG
ncbi:hypothetical protein AA0111_g8946 [Alternaria arborescens]|uniref:hypothetical protein n=1 Tax=Alternaria arborescens TaxID=156630 RepID=UPI001074CB33|nr:hypothetical protein AA0111_g8946 [Alternaria arborescens]RYO23747.1 hypothetical protein AA0111_g8946 [Alternaria arborescens]